MVFLKAKSKYAFYCYYYKGFSFVKLFLKYILKRVTADVCLHL